MAKKSKPAPRPSRIPPAVQANPVAGKKAVNRGPGKPFASGNQYGRGRPVGSRNRATLALEPRLEGEGEAIMRKLIERAKSGNEAALRLCLERLIPPRRERTVSLKLPSDLRTAAGINEAAVTVLPVWTPGA